jgi:aldehyde dehydrogenase (NAD+)
MNDIVLELRKSFNTGKTKGVEWRIEQLKLMEKMLIENENEICDALKKDLNKHPQEAIITEIGMIKNAIIYALNNIDDYVKPKEVVPQIQMRMLYSAFVQRQPLGVVLVIGSWNYPFQVF